MVGNSRRILTWYGISAKILVKWSRGHVPAVITSAHGQRQEMCRRWYMQGLINIKGVEDSGYDQQALFPALLFLT